MKKISILGSTGSIGQSALSVVDLYPEEFEVVSLAARGNSKLLYEQCLKYRPQAVALYEEDAALDLKSGFLANLGRPARESSCECERANDVQLGAVMALLASRPWFNHVGDLHFRYNDFENE